MLDVLPLLLILLASPARAQARFDAPFFFGVANAPGQSEDGLDDVWRDWARRGKVAAFSSQAEPERRLDFWSRPEIELDGAAGAGATVFRMGVDWGRVMPAPHVFDEKAIARYGEILRAARRRKLKVMLTLMHHSVPKWLQARGGWLDDRAADDYREFAERMIAEYQGEVDWWITFNEANVFAPLAYASGMWPPGERRSLLSLAALGPFRGETIRAEDRMADAHRAVYEWAHKRDPGIKIGIAHNMAHYASKSRLDRLAAWAVGRTMNWRFPERARGTLDFLGVNYYGAEWIKRGRLDIDPAEEYSDSGRAVDPDGLVDILEESHARFPGTPLVVTENGVADAMDVLRPAYLIEHLLAVARARDRGVPVDGYLLWTLSDNWEWADGYCPKFGLVAVDRAHGLRRAPRPSYALFRRIATGRQITPAMREEAWALDRAHVGEPRPFCRSADGVTPLDVPARRPVSAKDWRLGP